MRKLLAWLLCLGLLATGALAETTMVQFGGAYVALDGERFALNPTATILTDSGDDGDLIEFFVECNGEQLFPMQFKISEDGLDMLIGDSSNVYHFEEAIVSGMLADSSSDAGDSAGFIGEALMALANGLVNAPMDEASMEAALEILEEIDGRGEPEEGTIQLDGETLDAQIYRYELGLDGFFEIVDFEAALMGDMTLEVVQEILLIDAGLDPDLRGDEAKRALYQDAALEVAEYRLVDSDCVVLDVHTDVTYADGEEMTYDDRYVLYEPEHFRWTQMDDLFEITFDFVPGAVEIYMQDDDEYEPASSTIRLTRNALGAADLEMDVDYENTFLDETGDITLQVATGEDGAMSVDMRIGFSASYEEVDGESLAMKGTFGVSVETDADGAGSGRIELDARTEPEGQSLALGCDIEIRPGEIEDRTEGKKQISFASEEEIFNSTPLMLAFMGMVGDVERLMSEPSVSEMLEAWEAWEARSNTEGDDMEMFFEQMALPEFTVIPEDYRQLTSGSIMGYKTCSSTTVYSDGQKANLIVVSVLGNELLLDYLPESEETESEETQEEERASDISIDLREDYARAVVCHDAYTIVIECYGEAARYDLLDQVIGGIRYPDPAEEELKPVEGGPSNHLM